MVQVLAPRAGPTGLLASLMKWGVRIIDVASTASTMQVGRYSVGPPPAIGPQTLPLVQLLGPMPVVANRVQVPGPAIVLMQWEGKMNFSSALTFTVQTTTIGTTQGPIVFPSSVNFPFGQSAFWLASDPAEEVWVTVDGTSIAGITNAFMSVVRIPL